MAKVICPGCGRRSAVEAPLAEYRYRESGLPNLVLDGGVVRTTCGRCHQEFVRILEEGRLLQVIVVELLSREGRLTGPEMRFLRGACEATQAELASALRVRRATVAEREVDPRISPAEELLFRLVIMTMFDRLLSQPGRCHLLPAHLDAHRERMRSYAARVIDVVEGFAKQGRRPRPMRMHLDRGKSWEVEAA